MMRQGLFIVPVTAMLTVACGSDQMKVAADSGARADTAGEDVPVAADAANGRDSRADEPALVGDAPAYTDLRRDDGPVSQDLALDQRAVDTPAVDSGKDTSTDMAAACTPGMNQTCNDSLLVSAVWGTCTAAGTCICKEQFVVNPATGRCTPAPRSDASVDQGGAACEGEFAACGCGCCGEPRNTACYYPTAGETLTAIKAADAETRASVNCDLAGCAAGTRYVCCLPATPEPPGASYTASAWPGGLDHLTIAKAGTECATLSFARPSQPRAGFRIETGNRWNLTGAGFGPCVDAGTQSAAQGGLGTVSLRNVASACVVDVHVTLFAFTSTGAIKTTRLDADSIPVTGFGAVCQ